MIDGAPAPLVSMIGANQYKRCARDLYFFLQVTTVKSVTFFSFRLTLLSLLRLMLSRLNVRFEDICFKFAVFGMSKTSCLLYLGACACINLSWVERCCRRYASEDAGSTCLGKTGFNTIWDVLGHFSSKYCKVQNNVISWRWRPSIRKLLPSSGTNQKTRVGRDHGRRGKRRCPDTRRDEIFQGRV